MTLSLPSWSSASFSASMEPSASPSGFSWVTSKKRSRERIASATAATSLVVWGELIDQLRHADPALDRRIVFECELWCSLKPELAREPALQNAVRRLQTRQALALLGLRSEDTHVNPRVPQVRRGLDSGDGHEADPRVLQLPGRFREHLPDRLVNAPHSVAHAPYSIGLALKAAAPHCERPAEKAHRYDDDAGRDRRPWQRRDENDAADQPDDVESARPTPPLLRLGVCRRVGDRVVEQHAERGEADRGAPGVDGGRERADASSQCRRSCAHQRRDADGEIESER